MPAEGAKPFKQKDILTYEEILKVVKIAAPLGVKKIRITGGEPLARENIPHLISSIKEIQGIENISLTTNGLLLGRYANELAAAGLDRVNVSLDSLKPERYKEMTRGGNVSDVLRGIEAAEKAGLSPVKINMVVIRGFNDDEVGEFAKITLSKPYQVRFIEFMPLGAREIWGPEKYVPLSEIKSAVESVAPITPVRLRRSGPARYYRFDGALGVIGFINAISHQFCGECNRLRMTSDGKLRPCLFSGSEIDLKTPIRSGASDSEIERLIKLAIEIKPVGHNITCDNTFQHLGPMSKIGG